MIRPAETIAQMQQKAKLSLNSQQIVREAREEQMQQNLISPKSKKVISVVEKSRSPSPLKKASKAVRH